MSSDPETPADPDSDPKQHDDDSKTDAVNWMAAEADGSKVDTTISSSVEIDDDLKDASAEKDVPSDQQLPNNNILRRKLAQHHTPLISINTKLFPDQKSTDNISCSTDNNRRTASESTDSGGPVKAEFPVGLAASTKELLLQKLKSGNPFLQPGDQTFLPQLEHSYNFSLNLKTSSLSMLLRQL